MQIRCRISNSLRKYKKLRCVVLICVVIFIFLICKISGYFKTAKTYHLYDEPIDIVYTWVNGSDQNFLKDLYSHFGETGFSKKEFNHQRFDDKYELKFSLRSLEKYAPWVRHVYIVTNGQIPYWLNLDYEKVTLVTHEEIFVDHYDLPTFSSPGIEVHLHRIPGLSKRFIYFNDDIFLGSPLYIDDFYTESKGYVIYLAWPLSMCAPDCPWIYVADGQCDNACFNAECQLDGNDCNLKNDRNVGHENIMDHLQEDDGYDADYDEQPKMKFSYRKILQVLNESDASPNTLSENNTSYNQKILSKLVGHVADPKKNLSSIKYDLLREKASTLNFDKTNNILNEAILLNISQHYNLSTFVEKHNERIIKLDKIRRKRKFRKYGRKYTFRPLLNNTNLTLVSKIRNANSNEEAYGLSLQHSNRVFNLKYGFMPRYVPAHSAIMIDRDIMDRLQNVFRKELRVTSRNRLRSPDDMQFSFTYYYFLIHEKNTLTIEEVFDIFDTDDSGTWSDREIRTLLTKLYDLPLSYMIVDHFEYILTNCSKDGVFPEVPTPEYERYIDSKLPTISKQLVCSCPVLKEILLEQFGFQSRYNHEVLKNTHEKKITFKMLTSNFSEVVGHLDEIRRKPTKFICLNDNLDYEKPEENELVRAILYDFYLSLFPHPSKFELPSEYRNRFLYKYDLDQWKSYHFKLKLLIYFFIIVLLYFTAMNLCRKRFFCVIFNKLFC